MISSYNVPLEPHLGYDVGQMLAHEHYRNGVKLYSGRNLKGVKIEGKDGKVNKVVLDNGYEIAADVVIAGAGCVLNTKLAEGAGLNFDLNGGV